MKFNRITLCNLSMIFLIFICSYFFTQVFMGTNYFNESNISEYKSSFLFQTLFLAVVFLIITLFYTYIKSKRKVFSKVEEKTEEDIISENERLKSSLTIDLLTNVANKKYFEERFAEEYKRAIREQQYLSLLIVNIDEFRAFSDIYGRTDGDECLKLVANILVSQCSRPSDLVARVDKDEFFILLPNTNEPKTVSNKCVKAVHSMQIPHENSIASNVLTITIGTSTIMPSEETNKEELIQAARNSLQEAKRSGRNRVH